MIACNSEESINLNEDQQIEDYLKEMELQDSTTRDDSGIYYQIITDNPSGASPSVGDQVGIYFRANAANQEVFDANENDGTNVSSKLQYGTNSVLPVGLDICLSLIKVGETAVFYIPPSLAYGDLTELPSGIPPNSVIQMYIEMESVVPAADVYNQQILDIEQFILDNNLNDSIWATIDTVMTPVDSLWIPNMNLMEDSVMVPLDSIWYDVTNGEIPVDSVFHYVDSVRFLGSGIYYKVIESGIEDTRIPTGDLASITYQLYTLDGFPNTPIDGTGGGTFDFFLQQGIVITGLDAGIFVMEHEERALLIIPSTLAYQGSAFVIPTNGKQYFVDRELIPSYTQVVGPFEVLVFDVDLLAPPN